MEDIDTSETSDSSEIDHYGFVKEVMTPYQPFFHRAFVKPPMLLVYSLLRVLGRSSNDVGASGDNGLERR